MMLARVKKEERRKKKDCKESPTGMVICWIPAFAGMTGETI